MLENMEVPMSRGVPPGFVLLKVEQVKNRSGKLAESH